MVALINAAGLPLVPLLYRRRKEQVLRKKLAVLLAMAVMLAVTASPALAAPPAQANQGPAIAFVKSGGNANVLYCGSCQ